MAPIKNLFNNVGLRPKLHIDLSITFLYDLLNYVRLCGFYPLGLFKPLMEGYMEQKSRTPFLNKKWGFVLSETRTREDECKENRPYHMLCSNALDMEFPSQYTQITKKRIVIE